MKITELRKKLEETIKEYGISSKQAYKMSVKMDEAINEYMNTIIMKEEYEKSKREKKRITKEKGRKLTNAEWNQIAREKGLLSNVSLGYIDRSMQIRKPKIEENEKN